MPGVSTGQQRKYNTDQERQEYRNTAKPRERSLVQVVILQRRGFPPETHSEITNVMREDKREQQNSSEIPKLTR